MHSQDADVALWSEPGRLSERTHPHVQAEHDHGQGHGDESGGEAREREGGTHGADEDQHNCSAPREEPEVHRDEGTGDARRSGDAESGRLRDRVCERRDVAHGAKEESAEDAELAAKILVPKQRDKQPEKPDKYLKNHDVPVHEIVAVGEELVVLARFRSFMPAAFVKRITPRACARDG